ncbi:MAG: AbrB/MazE/SpoVT family DNA-binding domain-containing protein [Spirobacillus cienkowskii]|jgi:AbrB family looped-hinge helix DNA binding protein|uniref:AbrB/MazE/SpoVT family DNA-binding domain-containing protein n=1 Tax=Spirobacillus cienkowskii TaxID=495820 RepID=A0A369KSB9_9BACT|nr:MAG: AbrB/MazE/SpoVT family DNA-binding domain-containing protein [Spirobacillus cienkowskii]
MNSKKTKLESVVKVSSKGQIVIPKKWRNAVNICEGEKLIIKVREDHVIELIPLKKSIDHLFNFFEKSYENNKKDDEKLLLEFFKKK